MFWKRRNKKPDLTKLDPQYEESVDPGDAKAEHLLALEDKLKIYKTAFICRSVATSMSDMTFSQLSMPVSDCASSEVVFASLIKTLDVSNERVFPGDMALPLEISLKAFAEINDVKEAQRELILGGSSLRCASLLQGLGYAHENMRKGETKTVLCLLASDQLHNLEFLEAMTYGKRYNLPLVLIVVDRSVSAPSSGVASIVKREIAGDSESIFMMSACSCEPEDLVSKLEEAKKKVKSGSGPVVVVTSGCERTNHELVEMSHPGGFVSIVPDTVSCLRKRLVEEATVDRSLLDAFEMQIKEELKRNREIRYLDQNPRPDAPECSSDADASYFDHDFESYQGPRHLGSLGEALDLTYSRLLKDTKEAVLLEDENRHKVTQPELTASETYEAKVITSRFGANARVQFALGMALAGARPIVEVMDSDTPSMVLQNFAREHAIALSRSQSGLGLSVVIRAIYGGSDSTYAEGLHCMADITALAQSLFCVVPSTPADAVGLVTQAFACSEPIVVLENRRVRTMVKGEIPDAYFCVRTGSADVIGKGTDLSIITCGILRHYAHDVAEQLFGEASVEVVDLRSLNPIDTYTILASVARCSKVLILGEREGDFATKIASYISERGFWELDAPIKVIYGIVEPISVLAQRQGGLNVIDSDTIKKAAKELLAL